MYIYIYRERGVGIYGNINKYLSQKMWKEEKGKGEGEKRACEKKTLEGQRAPPPNKKGPGCEASEGLCDPPANTKNSTKQGASIAPAFEARRVPWGSVSRGVGEITLLAHFGEITYSGI